MSQSKQILSFLRDGNYAHPGEIEAIQLTMQSIAKNPQQLLLDVGCGLGGTAHYLQTYGFGKVTGLDIDHGLITAAKRHYPDVITAEASVLKNK